MTSKAFFLQRLNDHIQYLRKIEESLADRSDFQGTAPDQCKLGKWLYGDGRSEVAQFGAGPTEVFESLFEPHRQFHEAGKRALESKACGDAPGKAAAVTEMMRLSYVLVGKLLSLDQMVK